MAKFTATVPLNIVLPGGFEIVGAAGATHRIPDALYEEFHRDVESVIPGGLTWITQDETTSLAVASDVATSLALKYDKTGGTISGAVTITGALIAQSTASHVGLATFGSVIAASVTATAVRAKGSPVYDVKAYGATGDGTTDDTAAVQSAMDACHNGGLGRVHFPAGTYKLTSMVTLPYPYFEMTGAAPFATHIVYSGASIAFQSRSYATAIQRDFCRFEGFSVNLNGTGLVGFDFKGLTKSLVQHIRVASGATSSIGFKVDGSYGSTVGAHWNTFLDVETEDVGTGIKLTGVLNNGQANSNRIIGSRFLNSYSTGIDLDTADNTLVQNCDVTSSRASSVGLRNNGNANNVRDIRVETCSTGILHVSGSKVEYAGIFFSAVTTAFNLQGGNNIICSGNFFNSVGTRYTDSTTNDGTNINILRTQIVPLFFAITDMAANQAGTSINPLGGSGGGAVLPVGKDFQVRGITTRLSGSITGGTLTVQPTVGGSNTTIKQTLTSTAATVNPTWQGLGKDTSGNTNSVGLIYSTTAGFLPITIDANIIVWVEFSDG